jgi:hypothetical protein
VPAVLIALLFVVAASVIVLAVFWLLRSSSRDDAPPPEDEPVVIAGGSEVEMSIMGATLDAAGIRSFTRNPSGVYPYRSPLYGWELLVRYGDHQEARRVLGLDEDEQTAEN